MLFGGRDRRTKERAERPRLAVILAAGQGPRLKGIAGGVPRGFLRIGGRPLVHWSIQKLLAVGIEQVVIVTGYGAEAYENMAEKWTGMQTVKNPEYAESGSMYSLYCARDSIENSFLLLESDLLYEMRALEALLEAPRPDAVLLSGLTDLGDPRYVEAKGDRLRSIWQGEGETAGADGQFVGICRISPRLFEAMLAVAASFFREGYHHLDYDECFGRLTDETEVRCCKVDDLLWAKVDTDERLARVTQRLFPQIWGKDGGLPEPPSA